MRVWHPRGQDRSGSVMSHGTCRLSVLLYNRGASTPPNTATRTKLQRVSTSPLIPEASQTHAAVGILVPLRVWTIFIKDVTLIWGSSELDLEMIWGMWFTYVGSEPRSPSGGVNEQTAPWAPGVPCCWGPLGCLSSETQRSLADSCFWRD